MSVSPPAAARVDAADVDDLAARYRAVRRQSLDLCDGLETEDFVVQSMPDASPLRWHLAHTTWFFETFALDGVDSDYVSCAPEFRRMFNSYYIAVGQPLPRARRGVLSRPTVAAVRAYRDHVDAAMARRFECLDGAAAEWMRTVEIGLHHEAQHQELMLTDLKHAFSCNPLWPVYRAAPPPPPTAPTAVRWHGTDEGLHWIGHDGPAFCYDNERPRHRQFVAAFELADRPIVIGEYLEFMADGGYEQPDLWLAEGWATVQAEHWQAPLYWQRRDDAWWQFTLSGLRPVHPAEPVVHVSYFEADAYARWAGAVLPSEGAWEVAARDCPVYGNGLDTGCHHPRPADPPVAATPRQMFGDVWEWTASPYVAYPGYTPPPGALGEYNGKFMCNQMVLRGGSCATPLWHLRRSYRNFFGPASRWQFSGIRLARLL